jgi:parallel beta-helix repeat protein
VRRDVGRKKWKPVSLAFILTLTAFFGIFTLQAIDAAKGTTVSGHISTDTTWSLAGSLYVVMNDVVVDPGVTLTIEPGVQVRFDPMDPGPPPPPVHDYLSIFVEGNLVSKGRPDLRIEFTSDSPTPKTYDWWAIMANSSGHVEMSYSNISYSSFGVAVFSSNNTITNNLFTKNFESVVLSTSSSDNYVANNTAFDNTGAFLGMGESSSNIIVNNTAFGESTAIFGYDSSYNVIAGNTFINTAKAIGFFWDSHNNTIVGNTIINATDKAINLDGRGNDTVANNTITQSGTGIKLGGYADYTISNNTLFGCGEGLRLDLVQNSTIVGNTLSGNDKAIEVILSTDNVFSRNHIMFSSQIGMRLFINSSNNLIYHNNFVNNGIQALDDRNDSLWDDGYPSGGNYWSDYQGNDTLSGPNQNIPGGDGIGDTPHNITGGPNQDRYPLMNPLVILPTVPSEPQKPLATFGNGLIDLTWDAPLFDGNSSITNYRVYRGTVPGGEAFLLEIGNVTMHTDTGLTNGQTYYYRISAVNWIGEGPLSNETYATPTSVPGAPTALQSRLIGNGFENISITWLLSSDDGSGQDSVVGYEVYQNLTYDSNGLSYQLVGLIPNGSTGLTIQSEGEGDPNNYFYRICAVDLNDLKNCSKDQTAKFTRPLSKGPNLISIPLVQSDESVQKVLQTLSYDNAWYHDPVNQEWRSYMKSKPYGQSLEHLNHTMGIWVNVTQDSNLTVAGVVPTSTTIDLQAGWNLVGFPSFDDNYTVADLKAAVAVERIEGYDGLAPPYFLRVMGDGDFLQAGFGYWIRVESPAIWILANF